MLEKKMRLSSTSLGNLQHEELWHACAGPLVSLPAVGSRVVYFPQGHIEQVVALADKVFDALPSYPTLPPQLVCQLHNVTMHADEETDEVYAQMTLQTLSPEQNEVYYNNVVGAEAVGITRSKQPTNYFHKTLTASDTSTHGCCSIPRRAAEKVFPPLDFGQEPPSQELIAKDLHGNEWKFRHTFRGQPKRHLLTIGWTLFVNAKRLVAGDSVIFIWYGYNELLLGIRRANRHQRLVSGEQNNSMHVGLVAAHAAATNSPFTVTYFPRGSPSEFVIPLARYVKAVLHTRLFVGMRFRMLFETPESSVRRYMGKVVGIGDVEPIQWPNSHWRSVKVSWDEPTVGEKQFRVSPWEIEPLTTFPMYPSPFPSLPIKHQWPHSAAAAGLIPASSHYSRSGQGDDSDDDGISLTCSQVMMCFQNGASYNLGLQSNSNNIMMQQRFEGLRSSEVNPALMASSSSEVEEKRMTSTNSAHQFQQQHTENNTSSSSRSAALLQADQTDLLQSQQNFFELVQVQDNSFAEQQQEEEAAAAISAVLPPLLLSNYPDFGGPSSIIPPPQTPPQPGAAPTLYALPTTLTTSSFPVDHLGLLNAAAASSLECLPPPSPLGECVNPDVVDTAGRREQFVDKNNNNERFFF